MTTIWFRVYLKKPLVAWWPEDDGDRTKPKIAATLKASVTAQHVGKTFRTDDGRRFRIDRVVDTHVPELVGDVDGHGPYYSMRAEEVQ